jgi:RNA polymerase sigma-70 factor (ECF subfamily)
LHLTTGKAEADDLLQETLLRVHRARATYLPGSNVLHWAFAISRSAHLDRLRYWRRRPEYLGSTNDAAEHNGLAALDGHSFEAEVLARDLVRVVTVELGRMSEKNRVAYVLLKEEGLKGEGGGRRARNDGAGRAAARPSSLRAAEERPRRRRMEGR